MGGVGNYMHALKTKRDSSEARRESETKVLVREREKEIRVDCKTQGMAQSD